MAGEGRRGIGGLLDPDSGSHQINFKEDYDTASLKGQSVLITGGATGIGNGTVVGLAEAGAVVTIADYNGVEGEKTAAELTAKGHKVQFIKTDVSKWDQLVTAFKSAVAFGGGLDIVIPAAGIARNTFREWYNNNPVDKLEEPKPVDPSVLDVNLDHVYNAVHLALWYFAKYPTPVDRSKQIIFVSSMGGYTSMTGSFDYCTSKWGVRGLFRSIRGATAILGEGGPKLRCNLIAPTYVRTPLLRDHGKVLEKAGLTLAEVSDCTHVVLRMASDEKVIGRAASIAPEKTSFDLCDDREGLDAGRELALIHTENRFRFKPPLVPAVESKAESKTADVKVEEKTEQTAAA